MRVQMNLLSVFQINMRRILNRVEVMYLVVRNRDFVLRERY